jgi:hypothetical protein
MDLRLIRSARKKRVTQFQKIKHFITESRTKLNEGQRCGLHDGLVGN